MTDITTSELPPLPEPADTALVEGVAMQGSEYRTLSRDYEEWTARYSVRQMREYALAALSHARSVAPGGLTDEQIESVWDKLLRTHGQHSREGRIAIARALLAATPTTVHPTPADGSVVKAAPRSSKTIERIGLMRAALRDIADGGDLLSPIARAALNKDDELQEAAHGVPGQVKGGA
jgi:hypothetical protein